MPRSLIFPRSSYIPDNAVLVDAEGSDAEIYYYTDRNNKPSMVAFAGRQQKPSQHFYYKSEDIREFRKNQFIESRRINAINKKRRAEENKRPHSFEVGTILSSSWGYDQTNVDFYQVVNIVSKRTIEMRAIAQEKKCDAIDSGTTIPMKDKFIGDVTRHLVTQDYIRLSSYSGASLWSGNPMYWSSYA